MNPHNLKGFIECLNESGNKKPEKLIGSIGDIAIGSVDYEFERRDFQGGSELFKELFRVTNHTSGIDRSEKLRKFKKFKRKEKKYEKSQFFIENLPKFSFISEENLMHEFIDSEFMVDEFILRQSDSIAS